MHVVMKSVSVLLFRNEKLELQTAMALSLSKEDPSELPSPSSKPQEPKKPKSEDKGNNGEFTANETAALADFPVLAGSQEVSSVVDKSKETKKTTTSYSYGQAANASLHSKDGFPTLEASAQLLQEQPHTIPPGFAAAARQPPLLSVPQQTSRTKPPPGFQAFSQIAKGKVKENIAPVEDTTISKPEVKTSNSKQERNQMLIEKIRGLLGYDKTKFDEFKAVSGKFRKGDCSAAEYYAHCCELFATNFSQVFSELVDLLPDEERKNELLSVHQDAKVKAKRESSSRGKVGKASKKAPGVWHSEGTAWNVGIQSNGVSEMEFPSLPASSKKSFQPSYKPPKSATVLKQAWIRGK